MRYGIWFAGLAFMLLALIGWQPVSAQTVVKYVHTDALGSVVAITDENRNVIERREYEPYGFQMTPAMQSGPGYAGHVQDAVTGLVYMQQRYYDPQLGRFLSVDPVTALSDPVGYFGRYHYAANNPYTFTDPDGRAWGLAAKVVKVIIKGGDVGSTIAGAVEDARTLFSRDASFGQRAMALGSLATEVALPVSARDVKAGVNAVQGANKASDGARGADFVVTPGGTAVPTSQSRMTEGFEAAGMQGTSLPDGKGTSYTMPDGMNVRAMEPSGQAPRRASFNNSNGGPVTPDGAVPQPPRGASRSERAEYVRDRTHVEQNR